MSTKDIVIVPTCSMLINQDLYIGGDPIGSACTNDAVAQDGIHFYCQKCLDNMDGDDPLYQVTKPPYADVPRWHEKVRHILGDLLDDAWKITSLLRMNPQANKE